VVYHKVYFTLFALVFLSKVLLKEDIFDECIVSIDLHQHIKHKILFYKKVQRVVCSWRNFYKGKYLNGKDGI